MPLNIVSPAFTQNGTIPSRHTCDGANLSPALEWSGVPAGTISLVLIVDDPDAPDPAAPKMTWVHWVLYNLAPGVMGLKEGIGESELPGGTLQGYNDWKRAGYGGPCPPIGKHRYFFRLYALDTVLDDLGNPTKTKLEKSLLGHVIARAELVGLYQRGR